MVSSIVDTCEEVLILYYKLIHDLFKYLLDFKFLVNCSLCPEVFYAYN